MLEEKIKKILDQTSFLVEKQQELSDSVKETYSNILDKIESKIGIEDKEDILEKLKSIKEKISTHYNKVSEQINEDVSFLKEQLKAITQINEMQDKEKAEELLNMMVEKGEELLETAKFKSEVEQDLETSKKELKSMHQDLMNALEENNIKELDMMLEAVQEHEKDLEGESCQPDECTECPGCAPEESSDIFEYFKNEDSKDKKD